MASTSRPAAGAPKRSFDVKLALERIEQAVQPYPKAALFELAAEGFGSLFEQLVACIISIRTLEEVTLPAARRLFARARTPAALAALGVEEVDHLIHPCTFHQPKAAQLVEIARRTVEQYGGSLPADQAVLCSFRGVGPKCANLALGISGASAGIGVDIHVHRVVNRWGYVETRTPEQTMAALEQRLPRRYWLDINRLLVPFGKHLCTGRLPRCSTCPLLEMCEQRGVTSHR
jgi:endonuclease-3